jgi:hypothetical protein
MTELDDAEVGALRDSLDDEYRALATYDQVIADLGPVSPFIRIREAEARHAAALSRLFVRYGIPVPANPWPGKVPRFASVHDACRAAVAEEVENARLYDRLLASTRRTDLREVFIRLQEASQQRHLRAFQRCVARLDLENAGPAPQAPTSQAVPVGPQQRRHRLRRGRRNCGNPPPMGS